MGGTTSISRNLTRRRTDHGFRHYSADEGLYLEEQLAQVPRASREDARLTDRRRLSLISSEEEVKLPRAEPVDLTIFFANGECLSGL